MSLFGAPLLQNPIIGGALAMAAPALAGLFGGLTSQWGVFDGSGNMAIIPDTFYGVEPATVFTLSDAPLEQGSFATYNKVKTPKRITVRMATGGSVGNRSNFMVALDQMVADLNLYDVVSPEKTWRNMNCAAYDFRRDSQHGANMLLVNVLFEEIRIIQSVTYSSLTPPSAQTNPTTSTGMPSPTATVPQAQAVTPVGGLSPLPLLPVNDWGISSGSGW